MDKLEVACPLCGGKTTDGFIRDHKGAFHQDARWVQGAAVRGFGVPDGTEFSIQALRCQTCGHLSLFAKEKTFD